jgi:prepilin-type N-terminal cleavage/methylation domain-containing protein
MKNSKNKGFTLIELLVVIAIIGLLSTLSVVALSSARQKARNAKRVADIKQVQTALELYYNDASSYPATISFGGTGQIATSGTVYMAIVPTNAAPYNDGSCPNSNYTYNRDTATSYSIVYCISDSTGGLDSGLHHATPAGISDGDY